ncbi:MAG: GntR family transcriptional regulator [Actinobacteria bacterium]|nr:GntR family transcriptional regulator [Actinomycetota bacterium]
MSTPVINIQPRLQSQVKLLLDHIEDAGLKAGDRLASERELAKILGISRSSLREAIQTQASETSIPNRAIVTAAVVAGPPTALMVCSATTR